MAWHANRGLRLAIGNQDDAWAAEHELTRQSYRAGVLFVVSFNPDPPMQHEQWRRWNRENRPQGWDHLNDVPWWALREHERDKDALFIQTVKLLAAA